LDYSDSLLKEECQRIVIENPEAVERAHATLAELESQQCIQRM